MAINTPRKAFELPVITPSSMWKMLIKFPTRSSSYCLIKRDSCPAVSQIITLFGKPLALLRLGSQAHWPFQQKGLHQGPWVRDGWAESLAHSVSSSFTGQWEGSWCCRERQADCESSGQNASETGCSLPSPQVSLVPKTCLKCQSRVQGAEKQFLPEITQRARVFRCSSDQASQTLLAEEHKVRKRWGDFSWEGTRRSAFHEKRPQVSGLLAQAHRRLHGASGVAAVSSPALPAPHTTSAFGVWEGPQLSLSRQKAPDRKDWPRQAELLRLLLLPRRRKQGHRRCTLQVPESPPDGRGGDPHKEQAPGRQSEKPGSASCLRLADSDQKE